VTPLDRPAWKSICGWISALAISLIFLVSGLWKLTDPQSAALRMAQARVPEALSLAAALAVGIAETLAGVLVATPRFRRWGATLAGVLLVAFMIFVGVEYKALLGDDCSCFPWIKRVVGPGFFVGDALMLLLAVAAGLWTRRSEGLRAAVLVAGGIAVFAFVSYGVGAMRETGVRAPDTVTVAGKPYSIEHGKALLFFFNPSCMHCFAAAQRMATLNWGTTRVVAVPVERPVWAQGFLTDTGLNVPYTTDFAKLKDALHYTAYPWAVALENGRQKAVITKFDGEEPVATIKQLGFAR
jgi:uncharacterized membrane protein YphA (DoxX/SURF4 family)